MNTSLPCRVMAAFLLWTCPRCGGGEPSHPAPVDPAVDAGLVDAGQGAAAPETSDCLVDADCPDEEGVCLDGRCLRCGPARARVQYVYDGDTIIMEGGERVRFLLVNTPEVANKYSQEPAECYGDEALALTRSLLLGRTVELDYDVTCRDRYGRLLTWISLDGTDINALLLERGAAEVMFVPPNGASRREGYEAIERAAQMAGAGMWGVCQ